MAKYLLQVKPGQEEYVAKGLSALGISAPKMTFGYIPINIPESMLSRVQQVPGIAAVKPDQLSAIRLYTAMPVETKFSEFLRLFTSNPIKGPLKAFQFAAAVDEGKERTPTSTSRRLIGADMAEAEGITGKGVKVAVLDTGTSYDALFQGTFLGGKSSMPGQPLPWDEVGHGQWCNTCIGGRPFTVPAGQSGGMFLIGSAPGSKVAAFKVLGGGLGLGFTSSILGGLKNAEEWGADVISMSLGGEEPDDYTTEPQCQAITELTKKGIIIVIAAGNSGPGSMTIGCPGNCPDALTVGAVDIQNNVASFSSRGPTKAGLIKPDIVAPGVDILSTSCGYIAAMQARSDGPPSLACISGTSMATPHAAALVALAIEYARKMGKALTTDHIKEAMYFYGDMNGNQTSDRGWGLITWEIMRRYIDENLG
jgi:subtilisin family serine protease